MPEFDDVWGIYVDEAHVWAPRCFHGRRTRIGNPKGKGEGKKGRRRFKSRKRKEKRSSHTGGKVSENNVAWSKGKGKKGDKGGGSPSDVGKVQKWHDRQAPCPCC